MNKNLKQNASPNSSDIHFPDFINLYTKCNLKPYSFLGNDATLVSDNLLHFSKNIIRKYKS